MWTFNSDDLKKPLNVVPSQSGEAPSGLNLDPTWENEGAEMSLTTVHW
jgi:hypothetical protein